MAPVTGEEKYLSLESGHTAGFVKLAQAGGPTPEPSLATDKGMIGLGKLKRTSISRLWLRMGWRWTVVLAIIDHEFPNFAGIAHKALNVNNHVAQNTSELEMALSMTGMVNDPVTYAGEGSWQTL